MEMPSKVYIRIFVQMLRLRFFPKELSKSGMIRIIFSIFLRKTEIFLERSFLQSVSVRCSDGSLLELLKTLWWRGNAMPKILTLH